MRLQVLDESVNFSCGSCTACCDQPWGTLIEIEKARALQRHDFSAYPQLAGKKYFHEDKRQRDGYYVLAKGEGTRCLFLGSDGLCIIHKELGPQAKPYPCLKFPFIVSHTPTEDRVSVDFGCPSVQQRAGLPLAGQADEIASVIKVADRKVDPAARWPVDPNCTLTSAEADALFDRLITLFGGNSTEDLWRRFGAALALLVAVRRYKRTVAADGAGDAALVNLLRCGAKLPDTPEVPVITAYDRPSSAPSPARLLLAATLFRDTVPSDVSFNMSLWKRLAMLPKLMSLAKLSGVYPSRLLQRNVSVADVLAHPVAEDLDEGATQLLLRYFRARLWQRFLAGTRLTIIAGVHQHIHDLSAIAFFARAEAHHAGQERLTEALVGRALRCVEFHLANQPRLFDQNMIGWFKTQLESTAVAAQSLRLLALRRPPVPTQPVQSWPSSASI